MLSKIEIQLVDPITLRMDAKSAIECDSVSEEPFASQTQQTYRIKYHWLREHTYENGTVNLEHCSTEDMVADMMACRNETRRLRAHPAFQSPKPKMLLPSKTHVYLDLECMTKQNVTVVNH